MAPYIYNIQGGFQAGNGAVFTYWRYFKGHVNFRLTDVTMGGFVFTRVSWDVKLRDAAGNTRWGPVRVSKTWGVLPAWTWMGYNPVGWNCAFTMSGFFEDSVNPNVWVDFKADVSFEG